MWPCARARSAPTPSTRADALRHGQSRHLKGKRTPTPNPSPPVWRDLTPVPVPARRAGGWVINRFTILLLAGRGGVAPDDASQSAVRLMRKAGSITDTAGNRRMNPGRLADMWTRLVENHLKAAAGDSDAAKAAR